MDRMLYEYDYDKPDLTDEFLEHHGILGQKWGKRNGPPYPLGSDESTGKRLKSSKGGIIERHKKKKTAKKRVKNLKKARAIKARKMAEEKERSRSKEDIMDKKDLKAMKKRLNEFSNQEIQSVLDRIDKEAKFNEYFNRQNEKSKSKARKIRDAVLGQVKEGVVSGAKSTVKLVAKNATKMGIKKFASQLGGEEQQDLINKLFKEEKK